MESSEINEDAPQENREKRFDLAGVIFKISLTLIAAGIVYFMVKPAWKELFKSLPNSGNKNHKKSMPKGGEAKGTQPGS